MEFIKEHTTLVITTLVLLSHIIFLCIAFLYVAFKDFRYRFDKFIDQHIVLILFVISLGAMFGSLAYSNIIGFNPCELCWIQRILMYPQVMLSLLALWWKDKNIVKYLLPLTILGVLISFFHSLVHWGIGTSLLSCTAVGGECAKVYVLAYGYITIPFMAFTSFAYLLIVSLLYLKKKDF